MGKNDLASVVLPDPLGPAIIYTFLFGMSSLYIKQYRPASGYLKERSFVGLPANDGLLRIKIKKAYR